MVAWAAISTNAPLNPSLPLRQARLTNLPKLTIINIFLENPRIHHPRRLKGPGNEEVGVATPGTPQKWPISLVRPHQLAAGAHAAVNCLSGLLLRVQVKQILKLMPERGLARAPEVLLRARRRDVHFTRHRQCAEGRGNHGVCLGLNLVAQLRRQRYRWIQVGQFEELRDRARVHHVRVGRHALYAGDRVVVLMGSVSSTGSVSSMNLTLVNPVQRWIRSCLVTALLPLHVLSPSSLFLRGGTDRTNSRL